VGKKKTTIEITPPDADDEPTPEELVELNQTEGGELFRVTDELRATQGVRLMFVRTYPAGPDSAGYVGEMGPGEFTTERVRELYGPGKYKVTIMGPRGILPGGGSITIAKGVDKPKGLGDITNIAELIRAMEDRQAQQATARSARFEKLTELAIPGLLSILAAVLGRKDSMDLGALLAALKPQPGPSLADLTTTLANIQNLQGKPTTELAGLENMFKAMGLMRDFADGGGGGDGGKGSNWLDVLRDVVKEVVPAARPMLEQAAAAAAARAGAPQLPAPAPMQLPPPAPAPPAPPPAAPAPAVTPAPPPPPTASPEAADMWTMAKPLIRTQVDKLVQWATEKKRPDLYAEVFITELPQVVASYITPAQALAWLQHPEWWTVVKAHYPELEPHYVWLDQFRGELVLLVEEQVAEGAANEPT
jgi:hypothetical protein